MEPFPELHETMQILNFYSLYQDRYIKCIKRPEILLNLVHSSELQAAVDGPCLS